MIGCSTFKQCHQCPFSRLAAAPFMHSIWPAFQQCHQCPFQHTTWLAASPSNNAISVHFQSPHDWLQHLQTIVVELKNSDFFCWCVNDFFVNAWMIFVDVWMVSQSCGEGDVCALLLLRRWRCCSQSYADDDDDGHLEILLTWLKVG